MTLGQDGLPVDDAADEYQCVDFPDAHEVMFIHLNGQMPYRENGNATPEFVFMSTLTHGLMEMNSARGSRNTEIMTPLIAAFAILDQLGECYCFKSRKHDEPGKRPAIKRALHHYPPFWGDLSVDEAQALYMLRNGLVHDAAFSAQEQNGLKRWMIFRHDLELRQAVRLPQRDWNGAPEDVSRETITWFNPDLVLALASAAVSRLSKALQHDDDDLELRLDHGLIVSRYLLWVRNPLMREPVKKGIDREMIRRETKKWLSDGELALYRARYPIKPSPLDGPAEADDPA